ncbi:cupin domain-containing protein [Streptomyces sp. NPDC102364]|uniref:cupin domain-containing protein n=1 Tax=Streptomyces sp. NPDC102364 TaxID=3366161 RepID=UPI00381FBD32
MHSLRSLPSIRGSRKALVAAAAAALLVAAGSVAYAQTAAAGDPVTSETLSEGDTGQSFTIKADGSRHLVYRKAVIPPGASTGWHFHTGEEIAVIHSGTMVRVNGSDCSERSLGPGDALVEPTGPDEAHFGTNRGSEPVVLYITDVLPKGADFSEPAEDPGCENAK